MGSSKHKFLLCNNVVLFLLLNYSSAAPLSSSAPSQKDGNRTFGTSDGDYQGVFWQITDIHWDQQYSITGDETKMCHGSYSSTQKANGKFGNYLCDSPWPLVRNAIQTMTEIESTPDFILWTGDNVPHTDDPEPDFTIIFRTVNNITTELRTAFKESVPLLPVLGNHDAFPKDNYPIAGEEFYGQYLTKGGWSLVLPEDAQEDFKKGGFYEYSLSNGIAVMVLNTNLYYFPNTLRLNVSDPCGQFAWMRKKFQIAKEDGIKMIVAAHAPPGYFERFAVVPFFSPDYNDVYVDVLNEFGEVILAQIYGHEHTDSFKLFSTTSDEVKSIGFLAPSVTPWYPAPVPGGTPINPSLRLYSYSSTVLLDYTQYHLNLTSANNPVIRFPEEERNLTSGPGVTEPQWKEFYQARKMYGLESLDVKSMAGLYQKLKKDDTLFQAYYLTNSAGYNHGRCDGHCKTTQLCAIGNIRIKDLTICMGYNHTDNEVSRSSFLPVHPHHVKTFVIEDGLPVNADSSTTTSAPYFIVILLTLGMSLMVILTVSLAAMVVNIVIRRHRLLRQEGGIQVSDLNFGMRPKGYRPF